MRNLIYYIPAVTALMMALHSCKKTPVIYPQRKDIIETVYASGRIIPVNEYRLSSLSNGMILKKLVMDGDTVKKGQLLYVISNEGAAEKLDAAVKNYSVITTNLSAQSPLLNDLKLSVQNAEIRVKHDSLTYHRWKNLWDQQVGSKNNLDNAYTTYLVSLNQKKIAEQKYHAALNDLEVSQSNARSLLTAAQKELKEYYIRSERNGVVYQTFKEEGESVYLNETVALLGEQRERVIRLAVDQQDVDRIRIGQQVLLQADVTGNKVYEAVVHRIYPVMNEADQTFRVDARFIQLPEQSFIHSSIEANIIVQKKNNALVLPRNVLTGKDSVWIQGRKTKTWVETGISTLDYVEIITGIDEKTPVMVTMQK
jgi:HlyD family secretion protein